MTNSVNNSRKPIYIMRGDTVYKIERNILLEYIPSTPLDSRLPAVVKEPHSMHVHIPKRKLLSRSLKELNFFGHVVSPSFRKIMSMIFTRKRLLNLSSVLPHFDVLNVLTSRTYIVAKVKKQISTIIVSKNPALRPSRFIRRRNLKIFSAFLSRHFKKRKRFFARDPVPSSSIMRLEKADALRAFKLHEYNTIRRKMNKAMLRAKFRLRLMNLLTNRQELSKIFNISWIRSRGTHKSFQILRVGSFKKSFSFSKANLLDLIKNKLGIFRNLFFMLRGRFTSKRFVLSRRLSRLRPKIPSLRNLVRNVGVARKLFIQRKRRRLPSLTHLVVRGTKNNLFLSVTIGHCILFKLTQGFALRLKRKVDVRLGLLSPRIKRGRHDRASKKERKSILGFRAFEFLAGVLFRKHMLRGLINILFRGFIRTPVLYQTFSFFQKILHLTYRVRGLRYYNVISTLHKYLQRVHVLLHKLRIRLALLKMLRKTSIGLSFYTRNIRFLGRYKVFSPIAPYFFGVKKKKLKLVSLVARASLLMEQLKIQVVESSKLKKKPTFTRLNRVFFRTRPAHSYPLRSKKARRV